MYTWIAASLLVLCTSSCLGANILALLPLPARSHHILFQPLLKELVKKGHNITLITDGSYHNEPIENFTEIVISKKVTDHKAIQGFFTNMFDPSGLKEQLAVMAVVLGNLACEDTLSDEQVQRLLHSEQRFDMIMGVIFISQECFIGLGHRFKAPVVALTTFPGNELLYEYVGSPNPASFLPNWGTSYTDKMSFFQRGWNAYIIARKLYVSYSQFLPSQETIMNKYIPSADKMPSILELIANISLVLQNSQIGMTYPRPHSPNIIEVGGIQIPTKRKSLPQDLQEFMDNANDGVVYFSLGSVIPSNLMPDQTKRLFIKVFSNIKQKVLWKIDADSLPGLPSNVKLAKWLPQHEILAHKNCRAFISHGGMLSMTEAVHFGVPLLGFPFFGDQDMNMAFVEDKGIGIKMDFDKITYESLSWALNEILFNPMYYNNMKKQSTIFNDQPLPPMEKAIYWVEYVLRHQGAPHLQTAAVQMSWVQYFLVDVFLVILLLITVTLSVSVWIVVTLYRRLFKKKKHKD